MTEAICLIALSRVPDIGPVTLRNIIAHFGSAVSVFKADYQKIKEVEGIGEKRARMIEKAIKEFDAKKLEAEIDALKEKGIRTITYRDKEYPTMLREIPNPPSVIYIKGEIKEEDRFAIAVVGSRRPTHYGLKAAEKIASELASMGFTIVSGLARGIDTAAHIGALRCGGRTIAVLGSGINVPYPPENKALMEKISRAGFVLSEFEPKAEPSKETFPQRNRLISGLSLGVLVVEAASESGALITVSHALEQGREVFAVPGSIYSEVSGGTNELIKRGAKVVTKAADIAEELAPALKGFIKASAESRRPEVSGEEQIVCDILSGEPVHIDEISEKSGFPASKTLALLLGLELKGIVRQAEGKRFYLA